MPQLCCRSCFPQKTKPRRLVADIFFTDQLQSNRKPQVDIEGFIGYTHCTATQLDRFSIFARHDLVVLKSSRWMVRFQADRFLERRLAGFFFPTETLAQCAHRTEFHGSRKLVAATRTNAFGFRTHGSNPNKSQILCATVKCSVLASKSFLRNLR